MDPKVEQFMVRIKAKNPAEPEFHQAVQEVAESLIPFIEENPRYKHARVLERIAEPERDGGRLAVSVLDQNAAGLGLENAVTGIAQLKNVAWQALECEILVQRADAVALGHQDHVLVEVIRDRPAVLQRGQPRRGTRAHPSVHGVVVQVGRAPPAPRGETTSQHRDHLVEVAARQVTVGPGGAQLLVQFVTVPFPGADLGHDLLRQHVERRRRYVDRIQLPLRDRPQQREPERQGAERRAAESLAWDRYRNGVGDYLTVLDSQTRSFVARSNLLELRRARLENRIAELEREGGMETASRGLGDTGEAGQRVAQLEEELGF